MNSSPRVYPRRRRSATIPRMIEGLQFGTLEALITPPGFLVGINPERSRCRTRRVMFDRRVP